MAHPFNDLKLLGYSGMHWPLFFAVLVLRMCVCTCSHWHIWRLKINFKMAGLVWSKPRFAYQMTSSSSPVTAIIFIFIYVALYRKLYYIHPVGRIALPIMLRSRVFRVMAWLRSDGKTVSWHSRLIDIRRFGVPHYQSLAHRLYCVYWHSAPVLTQLCWYAINYTIYLGGSPSIPKGEILAS